MHQSRLESAIESIANILIGIGVALASQLVVFPLVGIPDQEMSTHLTITLWFTFISFVRSYCVRRWFDGVIHNWFLRYKGQQ